MVFIPGTRTPIWRFDDAPWYHSRHLVIAMAESAFPAFFESPMRSVLKSLSYRAFGSLATFLIALAATGRLGVSAAVGLTDAAVKSLLYFTHERFWDRVRLGRGRAPAAVVWLTGLPAAGKSTLARLISDRLRAGGLKTELLDGDEIRALFPETGFSRGERDGHARRVAHLASVLERHGVVVVVALVSPYAESRTFARRLCRNFIEVHVDAPLAVCEGRDPKGLYARARRGLLPGMTGVDDPYEVPERPEIRVDSAALSAEEACSRVMAVMGVA